MGSRRWVAEKSQQDLGERELFVRLLVSTENPGGLSEKEASWVHSGLGLSGGSPTPPQWPS